MKTREQILAIVECKERKSQCLDGRDFGRLIDFFPVSDWPKFGFTVTVKEGEDPPKSEPKEWTRENIVAQMAKDVSFGFDKAIDKRGISSGLMFEVVRMWLWVLDDPLYDDQEYAQYGLPLFKKVAVKYGFPNEIGEDHGDEDKYSAEYYNE